jgi:hypothetical protein
MRRQKLKGPRETDPSRRRARPASVVAGLWYRPMNWSDATTAEAALWAYGWLVESNESRE